MQDRLELLNKIKILVSYAVQQQKSIPIDDPFGETLARCIRFILFNKVQSINNPPDPQCFAMIQNVAKEQQKLSFFFLNDAIKRLLEENEKLNSVDATDMILRYVLNEGQLGYFWNCLDNEGIIQQYYMKKAYLCDQQLRKAIGSEFAKLQNIFIAVKNKTASDQQYVKAEYFEKLLLKQNTTLDNQIQHENIDQKQTQCCEEKIINTTEKIESKEKIVQIISDSDLKNLKLQLDPSNLTDLCEQLKNLRNLKICTKNVEIRKYDIPNDYYEPPKYEEPFLTKYQASQNYETAQFSKNMKARDDDVVDDVEYFIEAAKIDELNLTKMQNVIGRLPAAQSSLINFPDIFFAKPTEYDVLQTNKYGQNINIDPKLMYYSYNNQMQTRQIMQEIDGKQIDIIMEQTTNQSLQLQKQGGLCPQCSDFIDADTKMWMDEYDCQIYCQNCEKYLVRSINSIIELNPKNIVISKRTKFLFDTFENLPIILNEYLPIKTMRIFSEVIGLRTKLNLALNQISKCKYCSISISKSLAQSLGIEQNYQHEIDPLDLKPSTFLGKFEHFGCFQKSVLFQNYRTGQFICSSIGYWKAEDFDQNLVNQMSTLLINYLIQLEVHSYQCNFCQKNCLKLCSCGKLVSISSTDAKICSLCGAIEHDLCFDKIKSCYICGRK